jgi:pimeloyl-ACP methyl ester carboxylesterase/DNA-binding CsgD family transcriptional regulator
MDQEIRFLERDGNRVAYALVGQGPPLVFACWWIGHLEATWEDPSFRSFVLALARDRTVVRFDRPGAGLSGPLAGKDGLALETSILGAVAEELDAGPVSLFGASCGGCSSIALAVERPELVDRLVLYGAYADGETITTAELRESLGALIRAHWGLGAQTLADVFMPDADASVRDAFARFQRRSATPEEAAARLDLVYRLDASAYLERVDRPTLVLHRRGDWAIPVRHGRELAARIPGARFVPLAGRNHFPWTGDIESMLRPLRSFLGASAPASAPPADGSPLSAREREILALVANGLSDAEIARELVLSQHTVHRHVANVRRKLAQPSRAAAVAEAGRLGLI